MLPTFVIGLREGLEAALIVGIVAAFLRQRGRLDLLRLVFLGVAAAVLLCLGVGIALKIISHDLPQRQQEGLETVVGLIAVAMVTYMVVWMRRHSRELKGQLEGAAESALASGSGMALVLMAFLAVLREGFETVVFLLAAFNESDSGASAGVGAVLGIALAVVLGWGIYRGGVRINLAKFFRVTGLVLVLVAAGLFVTALHTAHEAGWLNTGQQATVDLTWLVRPGSVQSSLLTGMLGIQPKPVLIELVGWLFYLIPVGLYVAWPAGRGPRPITVLRLAGGTAVAAAVATLVLAVVAPGRPATGAVIAAGGVGVHVRSHSGTSAQLVVDRAPDDATTVPATHTGTESHLGVPAAVYTGTVTVPVSGPTTMTYEQVAQNNGGRLPLGVQAGSGSVEVRTNRESQYQFWLDPHTYRVIDASWQDSTSIIAQLPIGATALAKADLAEGRLAPAAASQAAASSRADTATLHRRSTLTALAVLAGIVALAAATCAALAYRRIRRSRPDVTTTTPAAPSPISIG